MLAVITGDIINSSSGKTNQWLPLLKNVLNIYGIEPNNWEIYRGDSFQLSLRANTALLAAFHIKSVIKSTKIFDARMAIGIGEESYHATKITESNGSAYINSGTCFENLKKQSIGIKTNNIELNYTLNLLLQLALLTADSWSSTVATIFKTMIENPNKRQKDLAKILHKSQSNISETFKRGGFDEIKELINYYEQELQKL